VDNSEDANNNVSEMAKSLKVRSPFYFASEMDSGRAYGQLTQLSWQPMI